MNRVSSGRSESDALNLFWLLMDSLVIGLVRDRNEGFFPTKHYQIQEISKIA